MSTKYSESYRRERFKADAKAGQTICEHGSNHPLFCPKCTEIMEAAAAYSESESLLLNKSREEELINLLDTLDQYLQLKSSDGRVERQGLRRKLEVLSNTVRARNF